jgi:hypothetical protein
MVYYIQKIGGVSGEVYPVAAIDAPISVRWVRCFDEPGNFELYLPSSAELFTLLAADIGVLVVTREGDDIPMYIEDFKLSESAEGETILISGRTMDAVMASRVVGYPTKVENLPSNHAASKLIRENMINPQVVESDYSYDPTARKLAPFAIEPTTIWGAQVSKTFGGENLLEAVDGLLKQSTDPIGLRCRLLQGVFTFEYYRGSDKPHVVFSADNEMLISCEYEVDIRDKCNAVFVSATGPDSETQADGSNPYTLVRQAGSFLSQGFDRREGSMSVSGVPTEESVSVDLTEYTWEQGTYSSTDGSDVSTDLSIRCGEYVECGKRISITAARSTGNKTLYFRILYYDHNREYIPYSSSGVVTSGTTLTPPANAVYVRVTLSPYTGETISPSDLTSAKAQILRARQISDYKADVTERGASGITPPLKILNAQIVDTGLYKAGVDYDLGDTVYLETARGVRGSAKITAITEVEDAEGYRIFPTFSDWTTL